MKLKLFKTLWGHAGSLCDAVVAARVSGYDGLEGQAPPAAEDRKQLRARLADEGLSYLGEICTAGTYVPVRSASPADHLESLRRRVELTMECDPIALNVIAGCDAWTVAQSVEFFGRALEITGASIVGASFETHRSRSLFNPWVTRDLLLQLPALTLTCDYSHWCVVCERLIDTEPDVLALCAERARHIHARVGYDQGPQVAHPAAPESREALEAHERWWSEIWRRQSERGAAYSTMTPEFGPDGYLHQLPFTGAPVADLEQINGWMAARQRRRFSEMFPTSVSSQSTAPLPRAEAVSRAFSTVNPQLQ